MNGKRYRAEVEAHGEAAERFADALRRSFPSVADEITQDKTISFRGTLNGGNISCTIESVRTSEQPALYSRHYDPTDPVVAARRKRLFEEIKTHSTPESVNALREISRIYSGKADRK
jgi:hypothetical protein